MISLKFLLPSLITPGLLASSASAVIIQVGSGADTSQVLIEAPAFGVLDYRVSYDYTPGIGQDAFFLLGRIVAEDSRFSADPVIAGGLGDENYFLSAITFAGSTQATPGDFSEFFNHYVSGGSAGFPAEDVVPVAREAWTSGSGVSAPFRQIAPGSSDALIFGAFGTQPSSLPVPEPSTALFGTLALIGLTKRRR